MEQGQRLAVSYRARRHLRRSEAPPHLRWLPLPPRRIQRPPAACGSSAPAIGQGRVCRGWFTPPIPEYCLPFLVAAHRHAFGYGVKQSAWILCSVAFGQMDIRIGLPAGSCFVTEIPTAFHTPFSCILVASLTLHTAQRRRSCMPQACMPVVETVIALPSTLWCRRRMSLPVCPKLAVTV